MVGSARGAIFAMAASGLIAPVGASSEVMQEAPQWPHGSEGKAVIICRVTSEAKLKDCSVKSEDPPGMGFGAAALKMAPLFKMHHAPNGGPSVEGRITIPMRFKLNPDGSAAAAPAEDNP
jgi:TonB family protein